MGGEASKQKQERIFAAERKAASEIPIPESAGELFERDIWICTYSPNHRRVLFWSPTSSRFYIDAFTRNSLNYVTEVLPCPVGCTRALFKNADGTHLLWEPPESTQPDVGGGHVSLKFDWSVATLISPDHVLVVDKGSESAHASEDFTKRHFALSTFHIPSGTSAPQQIHTIHITKESGVRALLPSAYKGGALVGVNAYEGVFTDGRLEHLHWYPVALHNEHLNLATSEDGGLSWRAPFDVDPGAGSYNFYTWADDIKCYTSPSALSKTDTPLPMPDCTLPDMKYTYDCCYVKRPDRDEWLRLPHFRTHETAYLIGVQWTLNWRVVPHHAWINDHLLLRVYFVDADESLTPRELSAPRIFGEQSYHVHKMKNCTRESSAMGCDDCRRHHVDYGEMQCTICGYRSCRPRRTIKEKPLPRFLQLLDASSGALEHVRIWRIPLPVRRLCLLPNGLVLLAMCTGMALLDPAKDWQIVHGLAHMTCGDMVIWVPGHAKQLQRFRNTLLHVWPQLPDVLLSLVINYATYSAEPLLPRNCVHAAS